MWCDIKRSTGSNSTGDSASEKRSPSYKLNSKSVCTATFDAAITKTWGIFGDIFSNHSARKHIRQQINVYSSIVMH